MDPQPAESGTIRTDRRRDSRPLFNIPVATPLENALYTAVCKVRLHNPTSPTTLALPRPENNTVKGWGGGSTHAQVLARPAEEDGFSGAVFLSFFFVVVGFPCLTGGHTRVDTPTDDAES